MSEKPPHHPLRRRQLEHSPAIQQLCGLKPLTASLGLSLKYKIGRMEKLRLREGSELTKPTQFEAGIRTYTSETPVRLPCTPLQCWGSRGFPVWDQAHNSVGKDYTD